MQNQPPNRKRPAPGASPTMQQAMPQPTYQYQQMPPTTDFTNFDFSAPLPSDQNQNTADDLSAFDANNFAYGLNTAQQPTYGGTSPAGVAPSTELVRRTRNQQLAPHNEPQQQQQQQEQWNGFGAMGGQYGEEDEQALERMAAAAKLDAQKKRKQIPPFVQKLSSFLDSNNTGLIRWSEDGRSFIVLDEDEFARTLIPELFKHSNYASFVRQLNMYGFHKTVNITDGSLRQSEKARKGVKPPSMYSHPYFRKNRPDLLWLIQKPATKSTTKRKRDGTAKDQYDSDDENQYSPVPELGPQELGASNTTQDVAQLPRNEFAAVRHELQKLQTQQKFISQMITQLKEQNDQFYRQASAFQALHDRHENSINAILTFLATFYNRSLEGHGAQNLVNMFTAAQNQQQQQQGGVVEEFNDTTPGPSTQMMQRFVKRPPLLLPGPSSSSPSTNNNQGLQPGSAITEPNSARASVSPPDDAAHTLSATTATDSPRVKPEPQTPLNQVPPPENNDQIMSLINSVNANASSSTPGGASSTSASAPPPDLDFNSIVDQYQNLNGSNPLTPQQRDRTLANIMRSQQQQQQQNAAADGSGNNALTSPAPTLNFDELQQNRHKIEQLQEMQKSTQQSLQDLNRRLGPHSPTGSIPGLANEIGGHSGNPFDEMILGAPGEYDPNAFINFDGGDFDFDFDGGGGSNDNNDNGESNNWADFGGGGGDGEEEDLFGEQPAAGDGGGLGSGRVESLSSEATSPATTYVQEEDGGEGGDRKRLRQR